jgi:hypothetical protein
MIICNSRETSILLAYYFTDHYLLFTTTMYVLVLPEVVVADMHGALKI